MQYAAIAFEALTLLVPLFIGMSKSLVKGTTKKWLLAIAAYLLLRKLSVEAARQKSITDIQQGGSVLNPNALATLYDKAVNPSGYPFLIEMDGTDEDLLFQLAAQTSNYGAVVNAYRSQYKRELTDDLKNELSTADYTKFLTILNR